MRRIDVNDLQIVRGDTWEYSFVFNGPYTEVIFKLKVPFSSILEKTLGNGVTAATGGFIVRLEQSDTKTFPNTYTAANYELEIKNGQNSVTQYQGSMLVFPEII